MPPCPSQLAYLPIFSFFNVAFEKIEKYNNSPLCKKRKQIKKSNKTIIYVITHTSIFEEMLENNCKEKIRHEPKGSIMQEEMNIRRLIK
jgi:hypothetical protein